MTSAKSAHAALRAGTAECHEQVDNIFSLVNLGDRAEYGRFLLAQAAAFIPVEQALNAAGAGDILPDWDQRQRGGLLRKDLGALGLGLPDMNPAVGIMPDFGNAAAVLGGVYVLEGSRLGGTLLSRSVATGFPKNFLGSGNSSLWRRLLAMLDERLNTVGDQRTAIDAARGVFKIFAHAGRQLPERAAIAG